MTSLLKTRVVRNQKIVNHKFEGKIYLLDPQKNEIRALNQTAGLIWQNADKNTTVEELIKKVVAKFDAPANIIGADVIKFVNKYLKAGLLQAA